MSKRSAYEEVSSDEEIVKPKKVEKEKSKDSLKVTSGPVNIYSTPLPLNDLKNEVSEKSKKGKPEKKIIENDSYGPEPSDSDTEEEKPTISPENDSEMSKKENDSEKSKKEIDSENSKKEIDSQNPKKENITEKLKKENNSEIPQKENNSGIPKKEKKSTIPKNSSAYEAEEPSDSSDSEEKSVVPNAGNGYGLDLKKSDNDSEEEKKTEIPKKGKLKKPKTPPKSDSYILEGTTNHDLEEEEKKKKVPTLPVKDLRKLKKPAKVTDGYHSNETPSDSDSSSDKKKPKKTLVKPKEVEKNQPQKGKKERDVAYEENSDSDSEEKDNKKKLATPKGKEIIAKKDNNNIEKEPNWSAELRESLGQEEYAELNKLRREIQQHPEGEEKQEKCSKVFLQSLKDEVQPKKDEVDWNEEFQSILEMDDSYEKFRMLSRLYRDFVYAAKTYGRIIISEKYLDIGSKTIKPFDAGGQAGGVKYKAQGILFKFAVDTYQKENDFWIYGMYGEENRADHLAAKAAGHELKGLINLFNTRHISPLIHYPLIALIDYRGFRLIAESLLPLHKNSLIYGSKDGGATTHADEEAMNQEMERIGKYLNLKSHHVGDQPIPLWLCGDIEGHKGTDGMYYMLDFARTFPPQQLPDDEQEIWEETRTITDKNGKIRKTPKYNYKLYKLLRPELVKSNDEPLNSDARSGFMKIKEERLDAIEGVKRATVHLINSVIPEFAKKLNETPPVEMKDESFSLTNELHGLGINCMHLGRIRAALPQIVKKNLHIE